MRIADLYQEKIAYYIGPKCGSRTILGWAAVMRNPEIYTTHPEWFLPSRADIYLPMRQAIPQLADEKVSKAQIRICVVREPVERFISAYTNRVLHLKKVNKQLTISELIKTIDDAENKKIYSDIIHHTLPLSFFYGTDIKDFTHVFNLRQINEVKKLLEGVGGLSLPNIHLQQSVGCVKPTITADEENWIKDRYKEDYQLFGKWF